MNIKDFILKLQNLPEQKKKIIIWSVVILLGIIMGIFWIKLSGERLNKMGESASQIKLPEINLPKIEIPNIPAEVIIDETTNWQTYKNNKYGFEIKYPQGWTFREYNEGIAFRLMEKPNDLQGEFLNIGYYQRGSDYCKIPFADYVKIAGASEIQNYESINTFEKIITVGGNEIYKTTWNYSDFQGNKKISLPITYFGINNEKLCGGIGAYLNDANYLDNYNKILSTFKFTK